MPHYHYHSFCYSEPKWKARDLNPAPTPQFDSLVLNEFSIELYLLIRFILHKFYVYCCITVLV
jgi:hypothetical protein